MYLSGSKVGDVLLTIVTVTTQWQIAHRYFTTWKKRLPPPVAWLVTACLLVLWCAFAFATPYRFNTFRRHLDVVPKPWRDPMIAIGNLWGMTAVASFLIYLFYRWISERIPAAPEPVEHSPERRAVIRAAGTMAIAAPFAVTGFGAIIERKDFQIKEVDLPVPNLHPDLVGLRIGQLSDLHVSPWLSVKDAGRTVDMLNECKPHLTVVTGDVITQRGDPLDAAIRELGRLRADAGVLGCLGNHEKAALCQAYETREAARYGIDILRGEYRTLRWGKGVLNVSGVDYQSKHDNGYLVGCETLVAPGATNLLLSHNPDVFPVAVEQGFDAMLAGHTHGGQVTIEILNQTLNFARFATPYVAGLYRLKGKSCYVTSGIGTIALPVRIGAPPEITVVRLVRA